MKRIIQILLLGIALISPVSVFAYANTTPIDSSYNNRIIDDQIFLNSGAMSVQDVQNFLNSKVPTCDTNHAGGDPNQPPPYVCLKNYTDPTTGHSAAQVIHDEAVLVGLNPQVILVTLQKEQSLVTDTWPYPSQYKSAMGYGCPESQSVCDSQYYGFFNQVHLGARLLRAGEARDCGDTSTLPGWTVSSQWALGNSPSVDGVPTNLQSCATGSLYNYTPHRPDSAYTLRSGSYYYGNYNFINYFTSWFGPTVGCRPAAGVPATAINFGREGARNEVGIFNILRGSGSGCVEAHIWNPWMQTWQAHIASNGDSINPSDSEVVYADPYGTGQDVPILVGLRNTGSGMIEFHIWNPQMKKWQAHIASNMPTVDPANTRVEFADLDGDKKDEAVLVGLRGTGSGKVEFHIWNADLQSWKAHVASNSLAVDPANSDVQFADVDGSGHQVAVLIGLRGTGSGKVEFHFWNPWMGSWKSHIASNSAAIDPANSQIAFADLTGNGRQSGILIGTHNTGSGNIEFHVWNPGLESWQTHIASNQSAQ